MHKQIYINVYIYAKKNNAKNNRTKCLARSVSPGLAPALPTQQMLALCAGSLYIAMIFLSFLNSLAVQAVVATERGVFYREQAAGMYSSLPFGLACCVVELPYILVQVGRRHCKSSPSSGPFSWALPDHQLATKFSASSLISLGRLAGQLPEMLLRLCRMQSSAPSAIG